MPTVTFPVPAATTTTAGMSKPAAPVGLMRAWVDKELKAAAEAIFLRHGLTQNEGLVRLLRTLNDAGPELQPVLLRTVGGHGPEDLAAGVIRRARRLRKG